MNVNKEAGVDCGLEVSPEELKAINAMSKKKLRPEEVYAFAVRLCSICGEEFHTCPHEKGAEYGGRRCWAELVGATDAYEWSFVAVPAQRNAGVMKHMRMEQEAALGRKYLESLRGEVARLGGLAGLGLEHAVLRGIADKLGYDELLALKGALERQAERVFPVETQLRYGGGRENDGERDGAFLI